MQEASKQVVEEIAVFRKGQRVYVGPATGAGVWLAHRNAPAAKRTEARLRAILRRGWSDTLPALVEHVLGKLAVEQEAYERVSKLERRLARARKGVAALERLLTKAKREAAELARVE